MVLYWRQFKKERGSEYRRAGRKEFPDCIAERSLKCRFIWLVLGYLPFLLCYNGASLCEGPSSCQSLLVFL